MSGFRTSHVLPYLVSVANNIHCQYSTLTNMVANAIALLHVSATATYL